MYRHITKSFSNKCSANVSPRPLSERIDALQLHRCYRLRRNDVMYVPAHALLTNHETNILLRISKLPVIPICPVISSKNCHTMEDINSDSTISSDARSTDGDRLSKHEIPERFYGQLTTADGNIVDYNDLSPPESPGYGPVAPPRNNSDSASSDPGKTLLPIAEEKKKRKLPAQKKDQNKQKFGHKYSAEEGRKKEQKLAAWMKPWDSCNQDNKKFSHKHVAPNHDAAP
mmetsp:Transcript_30371/g.49476  ORF Transcript_30371/g.49476 Transcript_30371/m.49476 type:complete len:229 (-) Transcript_30371:190-876(-)